MKAGSNLGCKLDTVQVVLERRMVDKTEMIFLDLSVVTLNFPLGINNVL